MLCKDRGLFSNYQTFYGQFSNYFMKAIERTYQYIDYKNISKSDFEKKCGISNGYLGKMYLRKADMGESIIVQILENCPDMSPEWLIIGNGSMLREVIIDEKKQEKKDLPLVEAISIGFILDRYEALAVENAFLKKENQELINSVSEPSQAREYPINPQPIGSHIAAEPKPYK
jgi:hypothetical protein